MCIVTDKFAPQGVFVARAAGMPDVPRTIVDHPVAGTGEEAMARTADRIADDVVAALVGAGTS